MDPVNDSRVFEQFPLEDPHYADSLKGKIVNKRMQLQNQKIYIKLG
jgi:hypothetical protein